MTQNTNKKTQIHPQTIIVILMIATIGLVIALLSNQTEPVVAQTPGQIGSGATENKMSSLAAQASSLASQKAKLEAELKATELEKQAELIRNGKGESSLKQQSQAGK